MPAWISAYCTEWPGPLEPDRLLHTLRSADLYTLTEDYDVPEDLVGPAARQLEVMHAPDGLCVTYGGTRPLHVRCWTNPDRVREELSECPPLPVSGCRQLDAVRAVVGIELGISQQRDMGVVLAYEVARWLGSTRSAWIVGLDRRWSAVQSGGFVPL